MIYIVCKPTPGDMASDTAKELVDLTNKLNCGTRAKFNDTTMFARPGEDADEVYTRWNKKFLSNP